MKSSVQARLDEESAAALETVSRRLGLTPSEAIRESLRRMAQECEPRKPLQIIGVGEFRSGVGDLATNKKHMEGFGLTRLQRIELEKSRKAK